MPLNTNWIGWATLITVVIWLLVTQKMRIETKRERGETETIALRDVDCERFPDQCPCTTELGKGIE